MLEEKAKNSELAVILPVKDKNKKNILARIEKLLKNDQAGNDFVDRVFKREYFEARDRIQSSNDPSLLQFEQQFANVDLSSETTYSSCIDNIVLAGQVENSGHDFFDY